MLSVITDHAADALHSARGHWAVALGAAAALLTLLSTGTHPSAGVIALTFALLSAGLAMQLSLSARAAMRRERRLVEAAAVLRMHSALLEEIARSDAVTGITNRRGLMDDLTPEVYRALRYRRPLSVLLIDVDHFKRVNDRHGHQFGDLVLAETARELTAAVRTSDLVARYGGEEFVVVLPETNLGSAGMAAEKLRAVIEGHEFTDGERRARITVSVGVATLTDSTMDPAQTARRILARADAAMYAAKHAGRNRIRWETDLPREAATPGRLAA